MNVDNIDVVIVGGGPVGACLALALPGLRVALLESQPQPSTEISAKPNDRAIVLSASSQKILQSIDVWSLIQPNCTPVRDIHVSDQGHFGAVRLSASEENIPALGYVIRAGILTSILHQEIIKKKNIEVFYQSRFVEASTEGADKNASCTIVTVQNQAKDLIFQLKAQLLVAADGTFSPVRTQQNIATKSTDYRQHVIAATVELSRSHQNIAYERFTKHGPLALLPIAPQQSALIWTLPPDLARDMQNAAPEHCLQKLQREFGYRLGRFVGISTRARFPLKQQKATEIVRPGLVLVGNAANTMHPIAGQGLNLGLRDIAVLAETLLSSKDVSFGNIALLNTFKKARWSDQQQVMAITHSLVGLFSNAFWPLVVSRNAGFVAMDLITPIRQWLTKRTLGFAGIKSRLVSGVPVQELVDG